MMKENFRAYVWLRVNIRKHVKLKLNNEQKVDMVSQCVYKINISHINGSSFACKHCKLKLSTGNRLLECFLQ